MPPYADQNRSVFQGRTWLDFQQMGPPSFTEMDTDHSAQGSDKTQVTFFLTAPGCSPPLSWTGIGKGLSALCLSILKKEWGHMISIAYPENRNFLISSTYYNEIPQICCKKYSWHAKIKMQWNLTLHQNLIFQINFLAPGRRKIRGAWSRTLSTVWPLSWRLFIPYACNSTNQVL